MSFRPVDHEARERARHDFTTSFVVEAGAGTGKTSLLVDRIEWLVRTGTALLTEIAAVTFTENAAASMKLRLRERLERTRADASILEVERGRAAAALDVLERAPISTIHALCAAMLQERPLECGVLPGFRVADDGEMEVLFAAAWEEWLAARFTEGDPVLLEALDRGIPLEPDNPFGDKGSLRGLARVLLDQRDLDPLVNPAEIDPRAWRDELLVKAARARELIAGVREGDQLRLRLQEFVTMAEQSKLFEGELLADHLFRLKEVPRNYGHRPHWPTPEALDEARKIAEWTKSGPAAWSTAKGARLHGRLVTELRGVVDIYERQKREQGLLDFVDLLLVTRDALRERESVRRYFRRRFRFLIIDEFQDTDRLQVQIARLLAGEVPGGLVVVGDAKQSIYRFRRAEVSLFRNLSEEAARTEGQAVLHLTQSFRARPALLRFVNRVFPDLIQYSVESDQPAYEPIDPPPGLLEGPAVVALRFAAARFAGGEDLLRAEARALGALLAAAARGEYEVRDPVTGAARESRAGDVMVLTRRLTQVRPLEEALEGAGLRFTTEGGKSFFDRQEVHEALAVLRAIDDPSDRVALVAALRSSFFGVSDRDIVGYHLAGGGLWLGPVDADKPGAPSLGPAIALLRELHDERTRRSVPALLERLYDRTRVLAALTGTRRGEGQVANLEKVAALARQATDLGVLTLRGFCTLLADRIQNAREEPDLPSTRPADPDTVRLLSIHKAKGLEAPIVALYDSADRAGVFANTVPLWDEGKIAIGFRGGCQPPGWDALVKKEEARARAEMRRLLYVAATRARDWLVVPKPPADASPGDFWRELSSRLPAASDADVLVVDAETLPAAEPGARSDFLVLEGAGGGDAVAARWETARARLLEEASFRPFVRATVTDAAPRTATAVEAYGAASAAGREFGRLVHQLLEWISFGENAPESARAMAEALAPSFGLDPGAARRAGEHAVRALGLPVIERARKASRVWRELPLAFTDEGRLVEGIVDLVFEEEGQLVVVDYKSDSITDEQALVRADEHKDQLRLYGRGLVQALGRPVRERLILFTALGRTIQV
jgi:ATP-dependent helicase/nuclease subunit A